MTIVGLAAIAGLGWVISIYDSAPSIASLQPITKGDVSKVYAADGSLLGVIHSDNIRQPVDSEQMPDDLKEATVAIEDRRFYDHGGIDPSAIIRAGWDDLTAGATRQGGSTITQQLVRNLYIENPADTLKRKIIEAHLANQEEEQHSKDEILTEYLNTAPYGTNYGATAIGVEAAAETYYTKHAKDLTLPEAAMLAGLPQAPSQYNPFLNPRAAIARRNEVLKAMEEEGYISSDEYSEASQADLDLNPGQRYNRIRQPYIFDLVKQELEDRYGVNTVQNGGLKVYTTIEPRLQEAAQSAVDSCSVCYPDGGPASALASVNPDNGEIVALASTQRYSLESQFNFAAHAQRQPGSSFKIYDLTAAIKAGIDPDTTYYDGSSPAHLVIPGGGSWEVSNAEPEGGGTMPLTEATWDSVNVIFAKLGLDVGPANIAKTAYAMGITSPLGIKGTNQIPCKVGPNCFIPPADAIGGLSVGVTPLEQADAVATLANGGVHHDATAIDRVVFPDGKVDEPSSSEGKRVLTPGQAYVVTKVLEGVITSGTGAGYTSIGCSSEAGKTGTSEGLSDAWFVGYTPLYATAVWTGHPLSRDYTGFGGPTSGPIWRSYMEAAHDGECPDFEVPSSLPELSSFHGDHTSSGRYASTESGPDDSETTTTEETTTDEERDEPSQPSGPSKPPVDGNLGGGIGSTGGAAPAP